jgi:hypothetical protein
LNGCFSKVERQVWVDGLNRSRGMGAAIGRW